MDYISSIFQLDQLSSDTLFQLPSLHGCNHETIREHMAVPLNDDMDHENVCQVDAVNRSSSGSRRQRKTSEAFGPEISRDNNNHKKKKVVHREIEKKRRQEMASLYRSLRTLLPVEYLKGKRSISDHICQTVNYIKHKDKKIQELSEKRDEMKRLANISSSPSDPSLHSSKVLRDTSFAVNSCSVGVQVVVDTSARGGLPLSKVLGLLVEEGMAISSCVSTSVVERMLHTVICQGIGSCISLAAELWALVLGLELTWERGFRKVQVEVDSALAIFCIGRDVDRAHPLANLISKARELLANDWHIDIQHTWREGNRVADALSKHALRISFEFITFDVPPVSCLDVYLDDLRGVSLPRCTRLCSSASTAPMDDLLIPQDRVDCGVRLSSATLQTLREDFPLRGTLSLSRIFSTGFSWDRVLTRPAVATSSETTRGPYTE